MDRPRRGCQRDVGHRVRQGRQPVWWIVIFILCLTLTQFLSIEVLALAKNLPRKAPQAEIPSTPPPSPEPQPSLAHGLDTDSSRKSENKDLQGSPDNFFGRLTSELASPWTTRARPWLIGGAGLTTLLLVFRDQTVNPMQEDFSKNKPLGDWSKLGDYGGRMVPNGLYVGGALIAYWHSHSDDDLNRATTMTKASLYAVSASFLLKYTVREQRPDPNGDQLSFPSGHTTAAFAFSGVVIAEHGMFPNGLLALSLATLTGLSRINDNQHFLHDVVAGATIGLSYGLGVAAVNSNSSASVSRKNQKPIWLVLPGPGDYGLTFLSNF